MVFVDIWVIPPKSVTSALKQLLSTGQKVDVVRSVIFIFFIHGWSKEIFLFVFYLLVGKIWCYALSLAKGKGSKKAKKIELSQTIIFLYFTSLVGSDDEIISL